MDRQLAERMVGAAVLLVALVVVVPAVLDGRGDLAADGTGPAPPPIDLRTHTIQVDDVAPRPPVPRPAEAPDPAAGAAELPAPDPDFTPEAAAGLPDAPAGAPTPLPAGAAPAVPEPEPAASPAAEPVPAPVAGSVAVPPAPGADPAGEWLVQLGSFAQRDNASRLAAAVRALGFAADVSETRGGNGRLFRVRVGPATTRAAADARARELAAAGYRGSVTRR